MTTDAHEQPADTPTDWQPPRSDRSFFLLLMVLAGVYILLIAAMLGADAMYASTNWRRAFGILLTEDIRYSIWLSLISCSITTILSLWVAVPIGYLLSRVEFRGKTFVDAMLDIPIFLPPLVIGLSLLILFRQTPLKHLDNYFLISLHVPAVILAQFAVASAFAVRAMRATFDEISPRREQVALTLGCSRGQAFWTVVLPEARQGMLTAATLAWARSFGEFGPILVFAGTTRQRTEVMPTSVFMQLSTGHLEAAVGVSLLMVAIALGVLVLVRVLGATDPKTRGFRP